MWKLVFLAVFGFCASSQAYDFVLPEGKVVIFGDSQPRSDLFGGENTNPVRPLVFDAIAKEQARAVLSVGDLVVSGSFKRDIWRSHGWETFKREICATMGCEANFFPAPGNHDYGGFIAWLSKMAKLAMKNYFEQFPHLPGRTYYSVLVGSALFMAMDSNFNQLNAEQLEAQINWAEETLKQAQADSHVDIVLPFYHHSAYSNAIASGKKDMVGKVREHFISLFKKYPKVRAVFAGHIHAYEHILEGGMDHIVTGIGPRARLKTGEDREYEDVYPEDTALRPFHYLRLTPGNGGVTVEMVKLEDGSWKIGEKFVLKAKADRIFQGN